MKLESKLDVITFCNKNEVVLDSPEIIRKDNYYLIDVKILTTMFLERMLKTNFICFINGKVGISIKERI